MERVDADLHARLVEQIDLYDRAMITGSDDEARDQAEAMVRGWRAACSAMESPLRPDDAYLTGYDISTNTIVVIADCKESGPRAERVLGRKAITITPDEVAKVIAGLNIIAEAKGLFPDAEVISFSQTCSDEEKAAGDAAVKAAVKVAVIGPHNQFPGEGVRDG